MAVLRGKQELAGGALVVDFHQKTHRLTRIQRTQGHKVIVTEGAVVYLVDSAVKPVTVVLPEVQATAVPLIVKRLPNTAHPVTITPRRGTIEGQPSWTLAAAGDSRAFVSDGENWYVVSAYP